jgi:hypothetical protein
VAHAGSRCPRPRKSIIQNIMAIMMAPPA